MKPSLKATLMVLLLSLLSALAQAQVAHDPNKPELSPWPAKIWTDISREVDHSGTQLTNVLFDQIDEFDLYSWSGNNISATVGIKRTVFDNQDILNTYTVNDQFVLNLGRSSTEFSIPLVPSLITPINFNLGVNGKLAVNHIRQVHSTKFHELPTVEELTAESSQEARILESEKRKWYEFDPSMRPRLVQFWNPLITLWRIPWTKEGLRKIKPGDLVSYTGSGFVSVGVEAGFLPLRLAPGVDLSLGMGIQTYVKGEFRITLLKESDRYVRVKLTKIKSWGRGGTVGSNTNNIRVFEGMMLFEGKGLETKISEQNVTVIPFKFTIDHENKRQFDVGYRFDLEDPAAQVAFEKAMRGNFRAAEIATLKTEGVKHLLTRDALEKRKSSSYNLGLKWIYDFGKSREKKDLWVFIQKPDGAKEIFKSSYQMAKGWSTLWGTGEKQNFLFTTVMDQTAWQGGAQNSFQLVTEALYEDVKTSGKEMHRYVRDVQSIIGNRQLIPELPLLVPKENSNRLKPARYQRSSFYFGQYLSQNQVLKFINTDPERAWDITLKSFDYVKDPIKKKGRVNKFYKHWMKLRQTFSQELNAEQTVEGLQHLRLLFRYHSRAIHAMRAIIASLEGEEIDYFVSATNYSFGRIQFRGRVATNAEQLLQMADETVDFENKVGMFRPDLNARMENLKVEQSADSSLKVKFTIPKDIRFLYFKVLRTSGWKKVRNVKDFIFLNKERFKTGENTFIVSADATDELSKTLWDAFKTEDFFTLQMSASLEGKSWGKIESHRFKFNPPELPVGHDLDSTTLE